MKKQYEGRRIEGTLQPTDKTFEDYKARVTKIAQPDYITEFQDIVQDISDQQQDVAEAMNDISVIENDLQFGFVKNTIIPLSVPIVMNWNFGKYTGMMKRVVEEHKINNLKLLPNNELSLSWNRELTEYFIKTD